MNPEVEPRVPTVALTVAGSDSGGGAGIQADLKTFSAHHVFGVCAVTSVTAQNTQGVQGIQDLPPEFVAKQMRSVLEDCNVAAAKTGMLSSAAIVQSVAAVFRDLGPKALVVDPVMVAKSGDPLLVPEAREALRRELLPLALLVTPNLPEAEVLSGQTVRDRQEMMAAAGRILELGPKAVLVKGGHGEGEQVEDLLVDGDEEPRWYASPRLDTPHTHGTGCTLSAAITARLALGDSLPQAVEGARAYLLRALLKPLVPGRGIGHPDHLVDNS